MGLAAVLFWILSLFFVWLGVDTIHYGHHTMVWVGQIGAGFGIILMMIASTLTISAIINHYSNRLVEHETEPDYSV